MARTCFCIHPQEGKLYIYNVYRGTNQNPEVFVVRKTQYSPVWIVIRNKHDYSWLMTEVEKAVGDDLVDGKMDYRAALATNIWNQWVMQVTGTGVHFVQIPFEDERKMVKDWLG